MKRVILSDEELNQFSTFEVKDIDAMLSLTVPVESAKEFISDLATRRAIGDDTYQFINEAYDYDGGFKSFKDKEAFLTDSYLWYITYEGPRPSKVADFDANKVLVVSVYRKSHGLKLVGIARRNVKQGSSLRSENSELRMKANSALAAHIKFMSKHGWAEISDRLEVWFHRVLGPKWVINPQYLIDNKIFKDIEVDPYNEDYYFRDLRKGGPKIHKIAYGTVRLK